LLLELAADREHALREASWAVARAIELDGADSLGYALRGFGALQGSQLDRYPAALADARRAHEMNPNDALVLYILAYLEAVAGEYERAIEHGLQVLRRSPQQPNHHWTYQMLAAASVGLKQYAEGIDWSLRAINDMPTMAVAHATLTVCLVGAGEIDKARAAFAAGQTLAPEYFKARLDGKSAFSRPEDNKRATVLLRIAADLEDPSAADALR
jgi:adenylate cyclase